MNLVLATLFVTPMALAADSAAPAQQPTARALATTTAFPELLMSMPDGDKKCGFDSDCSHGKCDDGQCGGCSFDSECKGFGSCKSGRCEKSPY